MEVISNPPEAPQAEESVNLDTTLQPDIVTTVNSEDSATPRSPSANATLTSPLPNPAIRRGRRSSLVSDTFLPSSQHGGILQTPIKPAVVGVGQRLASGTSGFANTSNRSLNTSSHHGKSYHTPISGGEAPGTLSSTSSHRRLSIKLAGIMQKFEEPMMSPTNVEPLSATGRRRSVTSGLQNRVQAFSPGMAPKARQILLTPKEVKELVMSSTTNRKLEFKSHYEQSVELQKKKTYREKQRQLLLEVNKEGRRQQWVATRAQFGEPVKYHGVGQFQPSRKIQVERSIDISQFQAPKYGPKTPRQRQRILDVVDRNFVFSEFRSNGHARTIDSLEALIDAFQVLDFPNGHVLWQAGDEGEQQAFYVVDVGTIVFSNQGEIVASAKPGDSLGEQSLIHAAPSTVTVAVSSQDQQATLIRLEPRVYRGLLQKYSNLAEEEKLQALRQIDFLKEENDEDLLRQLAATMTRIEFLEGEELHVSNDDKSILTVQSGKMRRQDTELQPGDYFGERSSAMDTPSTLTGLVPGVLYTNERERMEAILGTSDLKGWKDINHLLNFHPLNRAKHTTHSKRELVSRITKHSITKANPVYKVDKNGDPALYVVREGTVTIRYDDQRMGDVTMTAGAVFGHDILVDTTTSIGTRYHRTTGFSATGVGVIGILPVQDHESLLQIPESVPQDALRGHPRKGKESLNRGELELRSKIRHVVESDMDLADFERIKLLGEGMFGEVWLVAADIFKTGQVKQQFALKSQRKEDDTRGKDALSCIEREIKSMRDLNHAQLVHLVHTFEDEDNLYMLMNLIPGGELLDRIYVELVDGQWSSGLSEDDAKFYIYTIADTLDFIHSRKYIFRDLKPENIMLDSSGYPVLVDFGFAKYVEDKTYTFCGTPNYCAPEIILNAGHNRGVDHWALGVTLYEMVTGENPFFFEGMDTVTLYDAICREPPYLLKPEDGRSEQLIDLVGKLLEKNPSDRIGMLASGMQGILDHPWFDDLDTLRVLRKRWPAPWKPEEPEDKKTQAMMESSMTASFDGLAFMSMNDSHGSLSKMSFDDQPIAEDDGQHSSLGEMLDGSSRSFYSDPLHFSTDSFAHSSMREEGDTHHEEPRYDSDSSFHDQPIVCQDSLGVVTEKNVESSSRKAKKNEPSRQGRSSDAGAPKGAMGNINSIITSPSVAEFRKKKSAESKSRRSAISGALADLGIASDEDDIF